ncbi:MAG: malto-oligosyltrehalose trehalohydrolase [Phycicoccus sp.]|nr:malto-oligosyltrehalose trehalohydrolase [Phycicoccus sp.]
MGSIALWAPQARTVEIVWTRSEQPADAVLAAQSRQPMVSTADGWWRWVPGADDTDAGAAFAIDYAFIIDGQEPALPDPRSAWQPQGVHGPSRTFDPDTFTWTDAQWAGPRAGQGVLGGVLYELHVGTFTAEGTLDAAIGRLDDLVALGTDVVELMPLAPFPGDRGWGYDGVGPYAVHDAWGGPAALQRFVNGAHARGLGVCLDVVHNHLGPSGNYLARFGPYFTSRHTTPWGPGINLDGPTSGPVRAYFIASALRWFTDFHVDALRMDAVHELHDQSGRHYLAALSDAVAERATALGRPLDLIAESDLNDVRTVTSTAAGGLGMTAQWDDDVHHALHVALTGERGGYYADFAGGPGRDEEGPLSVLARVLTRGFLHDGGYSTFRDQTWGAPIDRAAFDARRLVVALQTHDQVGNRARGDRIHTTLTAGQHAIGAALLLFSPFTAMLFMGEEWAASTPWQFFTSFDEEWLGEAVRVGRRAEFGRHGWREDDIPDPQAPATRDRSVLRWDERDRDPHAQIVAWYEACLRLRRTLIGGGPTRLADVRVSVNEAARWIVLRYAPPQRTAFAVVANLADVPQVVPHRGGGRALLAHGAATPVSGPSGSGWRLGAHSVVVVAEQAGPEGGVSP